MMLFNNLASNRQAYTIASTIRFRPSLIGTVKAVKNMRYIISCNANAFIFDAQVTMVILGVPFNVNSALVRTVFDCIIEQDSGYLNQLGMVTTYFDIRRVILD